jgi:hypothetical protein
VAETEGPYEGAAAFRPAPRDPPLERVVPVAKHLRSYRPDAARRDLTAALTVAALAVRLKGPQSASTPGSRRCGRPWPEPARSDRRQPSPAIPSPISFAPITRHRTAMITALLAPIHAFSSSSSRVARSPSAK